MVPERHVLLIPLGLQSPAWGCWQCTALTEPITVLWWAQSGQYHTSQEKPEQQFKDAQTRALLFVLQHFKALFLCVWRCDTVPRGQCAVWSLLLFALTLQAEHPQCSGSHVVLWTPTPLILNTTNLPNKGPCRVSPLWPGISQHCTVILPLTQERFPGAPYAFIFYSYAQEPVSVLCRRRHPEFIFFLMQYERYFWVRNWCSDEDPPGFEV